MLYQAVKHNIVCFWQEDCQRVLLKVLHVGEVMDTSSPDGEKLETVLLQGLEHHLLCVHFACELGPFVGILQALREQVELHVEFDPLRLKVKVLD